jgi:hypothetical protein
VNFPGHDEPCYYCGELCNSLIGNPGKWPIALCHSDDPGKVKWHHASCISKRLRQRDVFESALQKISEVDIVRTIKVSYRSDGVPCKLDTCSHDLKMYESCDECIAEYAREILENNKLEDSI